MKLSSAKLTLITSDHVLLETKRIVGIYLLDVTHLKFRFCHQRSLSKIYIESYELRRRVNNSAQTTPSFYMFVTSVGVSFLTEMARLKRTIFME